MEIQKEFSKKKKKSGQRDRGLKNPELNKNVGSRKMGSSSKLGCVRSAACIQTKSEFTEIFTCSWIRNKELLYQT